jgi:hypothetical protein
VLNSTRHLLSRVAKPAAVAALAVAALAIPPMAGAITSANATSAPSATITSADINPDEHLHHGPRKRTVDPVCG